MLTSLMIQVTRPLTTVSRRGRRLLRELLSPNYPPSIPASNDVIRDHRRSLPHHPVILRGTLSNLPQVGPQRVIHRNILNRPDTNRVIGRILAPDWITLLRQLPRRVHPHLTIAVMVGNGPSIFHLRPRHILCITPRMALCKYHHIRNNLIRSAFLQLSGPVIQPVVRALTATELMSPTSWPRLMGLSQWLAE